MKRHLTIYLCVNIYFLAYKWFEFRSKISTFPQNKNKKEKTEFNPLFPLDAMVDMLFDGLKMWDANVFGKISQNNRLGYSCILRTYYHFYK